MLSLLLTVVVLGGPLVLVPGEVVEVPGKFYRRVERVEALPASYGTLDWGEGRIGNWLEASSASGAAAIETIEARLGSPLTLPPWGPVRPREAYVYALRASDEAGLVVLVDRAAQRVDLKVYRSLKLPCGVPDGPPSNEWEGMLITWFRWLVTPDEKLPPPLRDAATQGFPPMRVTGKDPFAPEAGQFAR